MRTTTCIACGKPAVFYAGHVTHFRRILFAGWCSEECRSKFEIDKEGLCGRWKPSDGVEHQGRRATSRACDCGPSCEIWRIDHPPPKAKTGFRTRSS